MVDLLEDQECKKDPANKPIIDAFKNELASAIEDELRQLATDFPGVPFDVELFKSITSKIILKKTGKLIPLVGVGFDVVQLKAAYAAGDYVAMGLALGSLLTEIIPCAMIADLGITAASLGNTLFKTYKSLSELKTFLTNNNSLFNAIFETIDELNLVDALELIEKWTTNSVGQFKIILGSQSIDDFLYALSQNLNKSWIAESWGKSMDLPNGVRLNYIPKATSGDYTTIEIIINGVKYKIRLE